VPMAKKKIVSSSKIRDSTLIWTSSRAQLPVGGSDAERTVRLVSNG
jgi:hypothetical protein